MSIDFLFKLSWDDRMSRSRDVVETIASFGARHRLDKTPDRVRALAKLHIVDGITAILAGAQNQNGLSLCGQVPCSNSSPSDLIGDSGTSSAQEAAFINTLNGRISDLDDIQTTEQSAYGFLTHPTVPVLAATVAIGQAQNASGEALLNAYLIGVEVATRLAEEVDPDELRSGFSTTAVFGGIGALFAVAKLKRLRLREIRAAVELWASAVNSDRMQNPAATIAAWREAHSARAAVESVLAAARCVPGFISQITQTLPGLQHKVPTVRDWGKPPLILKPGFAMRVLPCHPLMHPALDLTLAIVNLHGLSPSEILGIDVDIPAFAAEALSLDAPANNIELRRNLPFAVALAAAKGHVQSNDFKQFPRQKELRALISRVVCRASENSDTWGMTRAQTRVRVRLHSRRIIEMRTDVAKGAPQKPFSEIELFHKFFQYAIPIYGEAKSEQLLNRLWLIDEAPSVSGLCRFDKPWPSDLELRERPGYDPHDHGREHHAHLGHDDHDHFHNHPTDHSHDSKSGEVAAE